MTFQPTNSSETIYVSIEKEAAGLRVSTTRKKFRSISVRMKGGEGMGPGMCDMISPHSRER